MLPLLAPLLTLGLPALANLVGGLIGKIDNPIAQSAAQAISQVTEGISTGAITPEQLVEANRHLEAMTKLDNEREAKALEEINSTMRSESNSEDAWARRWRPFFGYIMACTWGIQTLAITYAIIFHPTVAAGLMSAMGEGMATMWWVALTVLGVAVVKRSDDKRINAGLGDKPSLLEKIFSKR